MLWLFGYLRCYYVLDKTCSDGSFFFPLVESKEELDFKDTELKMLVVGLKEMTTTKEVIQTLEQLLCDETSQLEDERNEVMHSRDTFQDLVRLMDQHRVERSVQLSILRQGVDILKVVLSVCICPEHLRSIFCLKQTLVNILHVLSKQSGSFPQCNVT